MEIPRGYGSFSMYAHIWLGYLSRDKVLYGFTENASEAETRIRPDSPADELLKAYRDWKREMRTVVSEEDFRRLVSATRRLLQAAHELGLKIPSPSVPDGWTEEDERMMTADAVLGS